MSPYPTVEIVVNVKYRAVKYSLIGETTSKPFATIQDQHSPVLLFEYPFPVNIHIHAKICDNINNIAEKNDNLSNAGPINPII